MQTLPVTASRVNRERRFNALEWCRDNIRREGQRSCMYAISGGVTIGATAAGAVHTKGVKRCASPWACPVCAPTIAERRAQEIDKEITDWWAGGGTCLMVTATLSHKHGDDLDGLLELLQAAWSRTWRWEAPHESTRKGQEGTITNAQRVRPKWYGGQIRTVEVTHGVNGWHPHIHAVVFTVGDVAEAVAKLGVRWVDSVGKLGGSCSLPVAWDVRAITTSADVAGYVTKVENGWSAGKEIAKADQKRHGVTPWMLLEQAVAGDLKAKALFKVYERATRGRRRIVASPGFALVEDSEAAEAVLDAPLAAIVQVRAREWRQLLRSRRAAALLSDVGDLAAGRLAVWVWPASWLVTGDPPIRKVA